MHVLGPPDSLPALSLSSLCPSSSLSAPWSLLLCVSQSPVHHQGWWARLSHVLTYTICFSHNGRSLFLAPAQTSSCSHRALGQVENEHLLKCWHSRNIHKLLKTIQLELLQTFQINKLDDNGQIWLIWQRLIEKTENTKKMINVGNFFKKALKKNQRN